MTARSNWLSVFGMPLLLGVLSLVGLLAALLGGEAWKYVSWLTVALPLWPIARSLHRARGFLRGEIANLKK